MSLATSVPDTKNNRDIDADFLKATIAEYESYKRVGSKRADEVADYLKELGHDVKKAAKPEPVETASATDDKPETATPKRRTTRAEKPAADDAE